jgi:hypothetical protein
MPDSHVNDSVQESTERELGTVVMVNVKRIVVVMQRCAETYPMGWR